MADTPSGRLARAEKANSVYDHGTTIVRGLTLLEALDTRRNQVWRAVPHGDSGDHAAVAVKLLHPAYEPVLPIRLGRRTRTLSRIVRFGTRWVPLLDHGYATDGRRYVVTPLHRSSLADQLEHGPTPWYPAAGLIADAASIVADAHAAGYSFGHLRPSGILIDGPTDVWVAAYGMSTRRFDDGTAQFMAPELADEGRPAPASDVFSLTLILASLIAGRPVDHSEPSPKVLEELTGSAPDRILEIIEYGLSVNLRNRYADAGKLARALAAALQEQSDPVGRSPSTAPEDAFDPLAELLAKPLVAAESGHSIGVEANGTGSRSLPDLPDLRHPDDTPTALPFDVPAVAIDDPTDPGVAAHRDLDAETDHFGGRVHFENRPPPPNGATTGPLADLLATTGSDAALGSDGFEVTPVAKRDVEKLIDRLGVGEADPGGDTGGWRDAEATFPITPAVAARRPVLGSIIDISDRPQEPKGGAQPGLAPTDHSMPVVEPSRLFVVADNVGHFLAVRRRRLASSAVVIGITGAIGVAMLIGVGDLLRNDVTSTDGAPVSTSLVEPPTTLERSSP